MSDRARTSVWWVSGGLLAVLTVVIVASEISRARPSSPTSSPAGAGSVPAGGGPASIDLGSMTPRQAADRLFDRVMANLEGGDTIQARTFLPMALEAYSLAQPLDLDGLFHRSLLESAAGQPMIALSTAEQGLAENPDHLLVLYAGARAAQDLGRVELARELNARILAAWSREMGAGRPEYEEHSALLPIVRAEAERSTSESGPGAGAAP